MGEGIYTYGITKSQISAKVRKVMIDARKVGRDTQSLAERVANKHGARVTPINYKSAASIGRKMKSNPDGVIKDGARTTIIASSDKIPGIISDLKKVKGSSHKAQTPDKYDGYSGHIVNVKIKGVTSEIQVNTPEMIFAKEPMPVVVKLLGKKEYLRIRKQTGQFAGWGHRYYEESRSRRNDNPKRRKGNASRIDSRNYYSNFSKK